MLTTKHYVSIDSGLWVFKSQQSVEESSVYLLFEPVFFYLYVVIIDKSKHYYVGYLLLFSGQ